MAIVTLSTSDESIRFMRASEEIELMLENTTVRIVNTADYITGEPPPANESPEAGKWQMFGVITGPTAEDVPENKRAFVLANWSNEIVAILESYGLIEEKLGTPS
jgi:hypothetical protein